MLRCEVSAFEADAKEGFVRGRRLLEDWGDADAEKGRKSECVPWLYVMLYQRK